MRINLCKTLSPVMLLLAFSTVSCFDDQYDLKKDIDMTVTVGGEKMVVPLGETEVITLDKLIDESETFRLGDDGIYAFKKNDNIDDVKIDVEAVNINIDNPEIDPVDVKFEESTRIDPFRVNLNDAEFSVSVPDVEVNQNALPEINLGVDCDVPGVVPGVSVPEISIVSPAQTQKISVNLEATTFDEIAEVKEVWFGDEQGKQEVQFEVDFAGVNALFEKGSTQRLDKLTVNFPDGFVLAVPEAYQNIMSVENGTTLIIKDVDMSAASLLKGSFYVEKFVHTFNPSNLSYDGEISFSIECKVGGTFVDQATNGKLSARLFVGNGGSEPFKLDKALVITKDIDVAIGSGSFNLKAEVTGLQDLDEVKEITFKENSVLELNVDPLTVPFEFHETSRFFVEFPRVLELEPKSLPEGVTFDAEKNHLVIIGSILKNQGNDVLMTLKGINFAKEGKSKVQDGKLIVDETLLYYAESMVNGQPVREKLVVKGGNPIFTDEVLNKNFSVAINTDCSTAGAGENMVEVANAHVVANAVSSHVETSADFEVYEEDMPKEVKSLKEVYLANDGIAEFTLKVDFREMPKEIKKGISMAPLTVDLPKFIVFADNPDIDENNVMTLRETFIPNEGNQYTYVKTVQVKGLDFTKIPEYAKDGLKIGEDRVLTIPEEYSKVTVDGKVSTGAGEEVNSSNFKDFKIYPTVEVENMTIGRVVGKVDPEIDPVNESVDLDLDDDLDFLKDDGNELHIQNPIINVQLKNSVGVPVNLDLHISGYKYGATESIQGSDVYANTEDARYKDFKLYPAIDGEIVTTHILISRDTIKVQPNDKYNKYVNVVIPDLSNLLVHLPDIVKFDLVPTVDQSVDHDVDITPTPGVVENGKEIARFMVTGDYDVTVPLVFEALDINYTDSVDNLNDDLWDFLDVATSAELEVKAELLNQLPADLHLTATALDRMSRELSTIHTNVYVNDVKDGVIPGVVAEGDTVNVPITIKVNAINADELKKLDKLRFNVKATISQTKNGVPLKAKQSVQLKNVKAYVKKVNLDLN